MLSTLLAERFGGGGRLGARGDGVTSTDDIGPGRGEYDSSPRILTRSRKT